MRWISIVAAAGLVAATGFGVAEASTASHRTQPKIPVQKLVTTARSMSVELGDSRVKTALVVATRKNAAEKWLEPGSVPPGPTNPRAYVIVLHGRFVCQSCSAPAGAQLPHGHSAQIIWVPGRGITDFGLTAHAPRGLKRLGRVVTVALVRGHS
jgi:hypothetical protein